MGGDQHAYADINIYIIDITLVDARYIWTNDIGVVVEVVVEAVEEYRMKKERKRKFAVMMIMIERVNPTV